MTNEEYEWLVEKKKLYKIYREDNNPESYNKPDSSEPGLLFHEFIFLMALIALNMETLSPDPAEQIEKFFEIKLKFDKVPDEGRKYKTFDYYLEKAQMRQNRLRGEDHEDSENEIYSDNEGGEDDMDRFEIDEKQK